MAVQIISGSAELLLQSLNRGLPQMFLVAPVSPQDQSATDIDAACRAAGLSIKTVAAIYGVSQEQFYQQCRGIGHLSLWRLIAMSRDPEGKKFLRAYMPRVLRAMGFPDLDEAIEVRDMFLRLVDRVQIKMAKAQIDERDKEGAA